jgi:short-subunit dehydrogenase
MNQKHNFIFGFFYKCELVYQLGKTPIFCTHQHAEVITKFWQGLLGDALKKLPEKTIIAYDYLNPPPTLEEIESKRNLEEEQKEWKEFCRTAQYYLDRINAGMEKHKRKYLIEKYCLQNLVKSNY